MERRALLKALAAAPLIAVAPSLLTTCGGESKSDGKNLTYWLWQDNATDPTWRKLASEFNASNKGFTVELQVIPLAQYEDKLKTALSSGGGPDAARFKDWWIGEFVKAKALAPLKSRIDAWSGKSDVVPALWNTGQVTGDGDIYMMPHQYVTLYMYYRKSAFKNAGLNPPETHKDVLGAARKLTDAPAKKYAIDVRGGSGGQVLDRDGRSGRAVPGQRHPALRPAAELAHLVEFRNPPLRHRPPLGSDLKDPPI